MIVQGRQHQGGAHAVARLCMRQVRDTSLKLHLSTAGTTMLLLPILSVFFLIALSLWLIINGAQSGPEHLLGIVTENQ